MPEQRLLGKLGRLVPRPMLMLADPDEEKVKSLLDRLSKFYWSKLPPEQCVLPDGTGLGRIAYDDIAAFNVVWAYFQPKTHKDHEVAITASVQMRRVMDVFVGNLKFRDAIMLLSPTAFALWLDKNKSAMDDTMYSVLLKASLNRHIH